MLDPILAAACFRRDGWRCRYCHDRNGIHPHHVIYRSQGGKDALNNLLTLCTCCHRGHHDGKLEIVVRQVIADNVLVQFIPHKGWKPS